MSGGKTDSPGVKGEVSWKIWCHIKNSKTFFLSTEIKSIVQICYKLSPQCTETNDECLWLQMDWVRMDCNFKKVRLTVFKFSRFCSQNALERVMSCAFQEFS